MPATRGHDRHVLRSIGDLPSLPLRALRSHYYEIGADQPFRV